jgi:hypothetical protein
MRQFERLFQQRIIVEVKRPASMRPSGEAVPGLQAPAARYSWSSLVGPFPGDSLRHQGLERRFPRAGLDGQRRHKQLHLRPYARRTPQGNATAPGACGTVITVVQGRPLRLARLRQNGQHQRRKFTNEGKRKNCSNVSSVAPDPGSCARVKAAAARRARIFSLHPDFFVTQSSAGQDSADLRNGELAGEISSRAIWRHR